jgi:hypothetical protein
VHDGEGLGTADALPKHLNQVFLLHLLLALSLLLLFLIYLGASSYQVCWNLDHLTDSAMDGTGVIFIVFLSAQSVLLVQNLS